MWGWGEIAQGSQILLHNLDFRWKIYSEGYNKDFIEQEINKVQGLDRDIILWDKDKKNEENKFRLVLVLDYKHNKKSRAFLSKSTG